MSKTQDILLRLVIAGTWLSMIVIVTRASIPHTPVSLPRLMGLNVLSVVPEGWGFFTRNPREPVSSVYLKTAQGWEIIDHRNASIMNQLGLRRVTRLRGVELAALLREVPDDQWVDWAFPIDSELPDSIPVLEVENKATPSYLCNDILIVRREPVPWAWANSTAHISMPARIVRLRVSCN